MNVGEFGLLVVAEETLLVYKGEINDFATRLSELIFQVSADRIERGLAWHIGRYFHIEEGLKAAHVCLHGCSLGVGAEEGEDKAFGCGGGVVVVVFLFLLVNIFVVRDFGCCLIGDFNGVVCFGDDFFVALSNI